MAALVALVVFLPALRNGFAYDDILIIVEHDALHSLGGVLRSFGSPWWPGPEGVSFGLWRPLASAALGVQWWVFGGAPWGFHGVNLLLHATAALLVVRIGARVLPTRVAVWAGLVFAVHPVHVEAVANVVGFAELAAAVLVLAAVGIVVRDSEGPEGVPPVGPGRIVALGALYLAACLTKEHAIVLPALLFVVEAARHRWTVADLPAVVRGRAGLYLALAIVAAAVLAARVAVLGEVAAPRPPLGAGLLDEIPRVQTVAAAGFHILRLLAVPLTLSPDYAPDVIPVTTVWTGPGILAVVVTLGLLVAALVAGRRGGRTGAALPLGLAWFVPAVLPISNVVFLTGVLVAERALYLPSVGIAWMFGAGLAWALGRGGRVGGLLVLVLGGLWVGRTVTYVPVWESTDTVFDHMVATVPQSARSQWVLGDALLGAGRSDEAVAAYARALGRLGDEPPFLTRSAGRLQQAGEVEVARILALRAVDVDSSGSAPRLLAVLAAGEADWEATVRWSRATLEVRPHDAVAGHLLSVALTELGRYPEARAVREELLARDPGDAWQPWYWLVELRARTGDTLGARAAADSARIRARDPSARSVIDSLVTALTGSIEPL